ncbi:MAG TPA: universal stress protein [Thermoanaerobaculia bacterium]|nr:universal stress protein [Thermoanaerobaculia bacterium]
MTIICGTDFSAASESACELAATLAVHHTEPLILVNVIPPPAVPSAPGMPTPARMYDDLTASAREAMAALASRLTGIGADVRTVAEFGDPVEVLLQYAARETARLIVVGAVGKRAGAWLLGTTADRIASRSDVPVLVARPGFAAGAWLSKQRPLRVVVASDLGPSTEPAVQWAAHLPEHGPCEFTVAHVSWPIGDHGRVAAEGPIHLDRTHPVVEDLVRRDLAAAAAVLRGAGETRIVVEPATGRASDALDLVARRQEADLLVVGRGRDEERHWWETSTSRSVVRHSSISVVCVPDRRPATVMAPPAISRIVAATDLSIRGNVAIAYALALAPAGAAVTVIHVIDDADAAGGQDEQRRRAAIEEVVRATNPREIPVAVEMVTGHDVAHVLAAAAERAGADLICLGSRGRSGLARALFGSVSQEVLLRTDRPVLLVQEAPPRM